MSGSVQPVRRGPAVTRLTLNDFRCYSFLRMEIGTAPVILVGPNGAGKTNILEALSFLAPGRGLRRARLSEATRRQAGDRAAWAVAARVEGPDGTRDVGTGRDLGSERRIVRIDGQAVRSQAMLSDVVSLLWLTPAMDRLFGEGAGGRRRFLDRLVLGMDPKHGRRAASYDHALKERSRLLGTGQFDHTWVDALEETMAHQGVAMAGARMEAVKRLNAACADGIGPFPAAELIIAGDDADLATRAPEQAAARFQGALAESRRRDTESGTTLMGPHRSDLIVRHRNKGLPAGQCSTGEQKAVLIAIILGQARVQSALHGAAPILLLDEVAAHLDRERRAALFGELCALSAQSWMTGTEDALFADMGNRGQIFHVDTAVVTALS